MSIDAVLFDLDGTLVDSAPDLVAVLNRLLAEEGRPPAPYAIARNEVSNGAVGLLRLGFGADLAAAQHDALRQRFLTIYSDAVCINSRLFLSLERILEVASTCAWGVVTNKPHSMTVPLLDRLGLLDRCRCVISGDRLPQKKPHPAPLLLAAEELGVSAGRCVYVGDAPRDIEAGRRAGMATIAAAYGYIRLDVDVRAWGAHMIVRRPEDLAAAVGRLAKRLTDDAA
jgi:phosphoglycolate phosphatase